jgi:hypothetical protein
MDEDSKEYVKLLRRAHLANARAAAPPLPQMPARHLDTGNTFEDGGSTDDKEEEILSL